MGYFPICLDITGRRCMVIGGGRVAERKALSLLEHGGRLTVIAPELTSELARLAEAGQLFWLDRGYETGDLVGAFLVIAATDDPEVQQQVHSEAAARGILLNVADVPKWCNFILPATARRGDLAISISTAGKSPALAHRLRKEIEQRYGPEYELVLELLGLLRPAVLGQGRPHSENKVLFQKVIDSDLIDLVKKNDWGKVENVLERIVGSETAADCVNAMRKRLATES